MTRLVGPMSLLFLLGVGDGCTRTPPRASTDMDAGVDASSGGPAPKRSSAASDPLPQSAPAFSAPIAALRLNRELVVAGLVAGEGVVRVTSMSEGQTAWTVDALAGVAWVPDAELKLLPAAEGVALVWRGAFRGKTGATLVVLGAHGEPRGDAAAIGTAFCTTADGVAWLDPAPAGGGFVRTRRWTEATGREVVSVPFGRAATLSCADHQVYVLGDGDDDLTTTAFAAGDAVGQAPTVAIRDKDFGSDDEREHEAYTYGDTLGIVRVGDSGTIAMRDVSGGRASAWRRLKHALSEDDDIVAVDGDAASTLVVFTREAQSACAGTESSAERVLALRVDRKTGEESLVVLAPAQCEKAPGPFWIGQSAADPVVAWVERRAKPAPNAAPIEGLAFGVFRGGRAELGRVDVAADALVDGACNDSGCFAAALVRAADSVGDRPEAIRGFRYPP